MPMNRLLFCGKIFDARRPDRLVASSRSGTWLPDGVATRCCDLLRRRAKLRQQSDDEINVCSPCTTWLRHFTIAASISPLIVAALSPYRASLARFTVTVSDGLAEFLHERDVVDARTSRGDVSPRAPLFCRP